jgi:hypothetical protein
MKKIFAIILLASVSVISFTSCTDDEVAPVKETHNNGGSPIKEG